MSLKLSSSFLLNCLQAFNENFMFTRVILLSVLVNCLVSNSIFSIAFLLSCIMKLFKPSTPKVKKKKKKKICPWFNVRYTLPVHVYQLSVFALMKRYFFRYQRLLLSKSIHMICWKNTQQSCHLYLDQ